MLCIITLCYTPICFVPVYVMHMLFVCINVCWVGWWTYRLAVARQEQQRQREESCLTIWSFRLHVFLQVSCCLIFIYMCNVYFLFLLAIALFFLRFKASDYPLYVLHFIYSLCHYELSWEMTRSLLVIL
jgi:hypothetical protein